MDILDDEILEGYRMRVKPTATCLTPEELDAFYADSLAPSRMEDVRGHIASCRRCLDLSREYCEFWELPPAHAQTPQPQQPDGPWAPKASWSQYLLHPAWQFAAAVVLLVGVGAIVTLVRGPDQQGTTRGSVESATTRLISPKGDLQQPPRNLEWEPVQSADHYEVEILDAHFGVLWNEPQVKSTRVSIPDDVVETLREGSYGWRVTAVAADGRRAASPFTTFRVLGK